MADIREIDMPQATDADGKKIRLVGDDGKGYWMNFDDLAAVVGGLLGNPIAFKGDAGDVNETIEPGYYGINMTGAGTTNAPYNLGTLIVLNGEKQYAGGGNPIIQIQITNTAHEIYVRAKWVNSWYSWRKLVLST